MGKRILAGLLLTILLSAIITMVVFTLDVKAEEQNEYTTIFDSATFEELADLNRLIWLECGRCECPDETLTACCETVLNRVLSDDFPNSISGVIWQKGQFEVRKELNGCLTHQHMWDIINGVKENGRTVLPDTDYLFFATKKQSCATDHVWVGATDSNGKAIKGKGHYHGRSKK